MSVSKVFVPGRLPQYTYNPRTSVQLESDLRDLIHEGGAIICVSGLTKMGKTVLVERLLPESENVRIDASDFSNIQEFWTTIGDKLGVYPSISQTTSTSDTTQTGGGASFGVQGLATANVSSNGTTGWTSQSTRSVNRPYPAAVSEELVRSGRALIIDDFHFAPREVQKQVVRSLKHKVFQGLIVVVISTSHRLLDVVLAEPNMDGRAAGLPVILWSPEELEFIAEKGFSTLHLVDEGGQISKVLSKNSFGSPHLMQKFCKEICKLNGIHSTPLSPVTLTPPEDWDKFFKSHVEGVAERWFDRLIRGPQERGRSRATWVRKNGGSADNYALVMEAISMSGDAFEISKDRIKQQIDSITKDDSPGADKTTRVLQRISQIASRPLEDVVPDEDDLDELAMGDSNFVLEYVDEGPNSRLHITDPFFAYYLRWGAPDRIEERALNQ